jgi:N,N'-diacetyllegionaminate synthase
MAELEIIAEAAQGYEGKPELAALLVKAAAAAGADAVKFQLVYADELATPDYQHHALFRTLEMPDSVWRELKTLADEKGIALYLDVFGDRGLALACALGCPGIKIHSTDMANRGLLEAVGASAIPFVLLSCAGCSDAEIADALALVRAKEVALLHGFQGYPTAVEANNIARIGHLKTLLQSSGARGVIGFADHAPADDPTRYLLAGTALGAGATLLEKHLTLSKIMKFEDFEAALDPGELAEFVVLMRACFSALGTPGARHASEEEYHNKTRKHVVALRDIEPGSPIEPQMVGLLRTSSAGALHDVRAVYGKRAKSRIKRGSALTSSMLEAE